MKKFKKEFMGIIFFGIILLVIGLIAKSQDNPLSRFRSLLISIGIIITIIGVGTQSIRQIDAGEIGIQKLFGKVQTTVLEEGLNFVNPLVEVTKVDVKTQNYTMTSQDEEKTYADDAIPVLTSDGLQVIIDLTALYRIIPEEAPKIIRTIGTAYETKIVRPIIRSKIRNNAAAYEAIQLYSQRREEFENSLRNEIEKDFNKRGFILEQLLIRKINLPQSVKESIERKLTADQEAQRMEFVLNKEKQEAERKRVEAQGVADAQRILNLGLSEQVLRYESINVLKELVKSDNAKVIIMGDGKNSTPVIIGK
jgi:regulator of protease activity HflC (stomatin/prohibitin superfamily)